MKAKQMSVTTSSVSLKASEVVFSCVFPAFKCLRREPSDLDKGLDLSFGFNPDVRIRSPTLKRLTNSVSVSPRQRRPLASKRRTNL